MVLVPGTDTLMGYLDDHRTDPWEIGKGPIGTAQRSLPRGEIDVSRWLPR